MKLTFKSMKLVTKILIVICGVNQIIIHIIIYCPNYRDLNRPRNTYVNNVNIMVANDRNVNSGFQLLGRTKSPGNKKLIQIKIFLYILSNFMYENVLSTSIYLDLLLQEKIWWIRRGKGFSLEAGIQGKFLIERRVSVNKNGW